MQAPHEVLSSLATLGCFTPAPSLPRPGCVARLVKACRRRLLDPSGGGLAPVTAAWALAVMQVQHFHFFLFCCAFVLLCE